MFVESLAVDKSWMFECFNVDGFLSFSSLEAMDQHCIQELKYGQQTASQEQTHKPTKLTWQEQESSPWKRKSMVRQEGSISQQGHPESL